MRYENGEIRLTKDEIFYSGGQQVVNLGQDALVPVAPYEAVSLLGGLVSRLEAFRIGGAPLQGHELDAARSILTAIETGAQALRESINDASPPSSKITPVIGSQEPVNQRITPSVR